MSDCDGRTDLENFHLSDLKNYPTSENRTKNHNLICFTIAKKNKPNN